jgi:hypothetical protein
MKVATICMTKSAVAIEEQDEYIERYEEERVSACVSKFNTQ